MTTPPPSDPSNDNDLIEVERAACEKAKTGDPKAIKVWLRLRRLRRGPIGLGPIDDIASLQEAQGKIITEFDGQEMDPFVALTYGRLMEYRRRTIATVEHERRIQALEEKYDAEPPRAVGRRGGR